MAQNWTSDVFAVHIDSSIFYMPLLILSRYSPFTSTAAKILTHFNTPYGPWVSLSIFLILHWQLSIYC